MTGKFSQARPHPSLGRSFFGDTNADARAVFALAHLAIISRLIHRDTTLQKLRAVRCTMYYVGNEEPTFQLITISSNISTVLNVIQ